MPTSTWSENLQKETREAIRELRVAPDGLLHFKHKTLGYASMTFDNVCEGKLHLHHNKIGHTFEFFDADQLLACGWVID